MRKAILLLHFGALVQGLVQEGSLRILCFGDSITAGFTDHGNSRHPYAGALKASLEESFPDLNITTDNHGLSGDQVQQPPGSYLPRMTAIYADAEYDYAVILGGTNDLWQWRDSSAILIALQKVWDIPLSHGTKVLAMTVPDSANTPQGINEKRDNLNRLILDHHEDNFFLLDLRKKVPYFDMPEDRRSELWDDGTHFTPRGYDLVGTIVADRLVELVTQEGGAVVDNNMENEQAEL